MKIPMIFARRKPRRTTQGTQMLSQLSTREWADLPIHHPHSQEV